MPPRIIVLPRKIIDGKRFSALGGYFSSNSGAERLAKHAKQLNPNMKYRIVKESPNRYQLYVRGLKKRTPEQFLSPRKGGNGSIHVRAHARKGTKGVRAHTRKR